MTPWQQTWKTRATKSEKMVDGGVTAKVSAPCDSQPDSHLCSSASHRNLFAHAERTSRTERRQHLAAQPYFRSTSWKQVSLSCTSEAGTSVSASAMNGGPKAVQRSRPGLSTCFSHPPVAAAFEDFSPSPRSSSAPQALLVRAHEMVFCRYDGEAGPRCCGW
jgi:hypothetical protein